MASAYVRSARQLWQMRARLTQKSCSNTIVGPPSAFDFRRSKFSRANASRGSWMRVANLERVSFHHQIDHSRLRSREQGFEEPQPASVARPPSFQVVGPSAHPS